MSFYDDASLVFLPSGGAGKDGKVYNMKPVPEYGNELVTNGGFNTDSDWVKETGWTISGGTANCDGTQTSTSQLRTSVGLSIQNTLVEFSFEVKNYSAGTLTATIEGTGGNEFSGINSNGVYTIQATSSDLNPRIVFNADSSFIGSIDSVSVKEVIVGDADFTFSRGGDLTATRVNSNGLIEKGRENLITQSNDLSDFTPQGLTTTPNQADPFGGNNATLFTENLSGGNHRFYLLNVPSSSAVHTYSMYVKYNGRSRFKLVINGGNPNATFNTQTGAHITDSGNIIDYKTESIGNDWHRISFASVCSGWVGGYFVNDSGQDSYTGDGTSGIVLFGAQVELGSVATEYISSGASSGKAGILENSPRFDYSGGASCPSLLLEPSRTNLVKYSEYFENSQWLVDGVSLDANNITSPEGLQNAYKITDDATNGYHLITDSDVFLADGVMRTWSVFVKKGTARYCVIGAGNQFVVQDNALIFDMEGGTYTSTGTSSFFNTIHDPVNMGNGWYRIGFSSDLNSSSYNKLSIGVSQGATWSGNVSYTGDGSLNYYIYGAQVEEGSYPTSYIPNHSGGSVTRGGDSATASNVASLIGQTEGTIFIDVNMNAENGDVINIKPISGSFYANGIGLGNLSQSLRLQVHKPSGTTQVVYPLSVEGRFKFAIRYDSNNLAFFVNGSKFYDNPVTIDWSVDLNDVALFDAWTTGSRSVKKNKQTLLFQTALSDAECITLTS